MKVLEEAMVEGPALSLRVVFEHGVVGCPMEEEKRRQI
jgi:hypothetical protein